MALVYIVPIQKMISESVLTISGLSKLKQIMVVEKKGIKSSMARSLPVENLLPQNVGSIINNLQ